MYMALMSSLIWGRHEFFLPIHSAHDDVFPAIPHDEMRHLCGHVMGGTAKIVR